MKSKPFVVKFSDNPIIRGANQTAVAIIAAGCAETLSEPVKAVSSKSHRVEVNAVSALSSGKTRHDRPHKRGRGSYHDNSRRKRCNRIVICDDGGSVIPMKIPFFSLIPGR